MSIFQSGLSNDVRKLRKDSSNGLNRFKKSFENSQAIMLNENFSTFEIHIRNIFEEKFLTNEKNMNEILLVIADNVKIVGKDINGSLVKIWDLIKEGIERMDIYHNENEFRFLELDTYFKEFLENDDMHNRIIPINQEKINENIQQYHQETMYLLNEFFVNINQNLESITRES
jgi:hypothetical protein